MARYCYRAIRKSDGVEIDRDEIEDIADRGMGVAATAVRASLIQSHPEAERLAHNDIDIEMSIIIPSQS